MPTPVLNLPMPGAMLQVTPGFKPTIIQGITIHPDNPLEFDFIINTGDTNLQGQELEEESKKLIKYFLASLTVPEEDMWVNLSPHEKDQMIPESFGDTEMGRDMLAQDYLLKQLTASLIYPEEELGKSFWEKTYEKVRQKYGSIDVPINTFNKVWIVPEKAVVYEDGNTAMVLNSRLKVMLEEDYVAVQQNMNDQDPLDTSYRSEASQVVRDLIIPEIEREVNQGKTFANLRQIYNSMILATWYKLNLKQSLLGQVYVDQNKTKGVDTKDKEVNEKIYQQYLDAFETGVFNYIKEEYDPNVEDVIPRKYFSGGFGTTDQKGKKLLSTMILKELILGSQLPAFAKVNVARRLLTEYSGNDHKLLVGLLEYSKGNYVVVITDEEDRIQSIDSGYAVAASPLSATDSVSSPVEDVFSSSPIKNLRLNSSVLRSATLLSVLGLPALFLPSESAAISSEDLQDVQQISHGLLSLSHSRTHLAPSHFGHPGFEDLVFTYDKAVDAMVLKAAGKQEEAEAVLDYFATKLRIPVAEVQRRADTNGTYGLLKLLEAAKKKGKASTSGGISLSDLSTTFANLMETPSAEETEFVIGLINALDRTSMKKQGMGQLEYYTTPGPMSFMIFAFLNVNPDKYKEEAIMLGETLLSMQANDGGLRDGDRGPGKVHTEPHNDAVAAFWQLYEVTGDEKWKTAGDAAYQWFKTNVSFPKRGEIYQGIWETGPSTIHATDAYTWTLAGPIGDKIVEEEGLDALARYTDHVLKRSLTQVTLELPDGEKKTVILVDFTDPTDPKVKNDRIKDPGVNNDPGVDVDQKGFHPMGSVEWTAGAVMMLQKNAVRFAQSSNSADQQRARLYKAIAEILKEQSLNSFYELRSIGVDLPGSLSFYATGQGSAVGHGWNTPYFYVKPKQGRAVKGGSSVASWVVLPIMGSNPFILNDDYLGEYEAIPFKGSIKRAAQRIIDKLVKGRTFTEKIPTKAPDAGTQIVEPGKYNSQMWSAFNNGDFKQVIKWAQKTIDEENWVRLAQRDQQQKAKEVGGIISYPWGTSFPNNEHALHEAIWRYPLLNEVAVAMWALATAHFELGYHEESKKWMKRIIQEVPFHQIADGGWTGSGGSRYFKISGYWNALVSWQYNPGGHARDQKMGVLYREVLSDLDISNAAPREVPLSRIKRAPMIAGGTVTGIPSHLKAKVSKEQSHKTKKRKLVPPSVQKKSVNTTQSEGYGTTLSDVAQLTTNNPGQVRRHPAFKAIVRRGNKAKTSSGTIDALVTNLQALGANTDSRKWSALLLGKVGSSQYERVKGVLEAVLNNEGGIYQSWHQAEARNGLQILKESVPKSKKKSPSKKKGTPETQALEQTLNNVKQLTMSHPSSARRHPAFQAIVRRGRTAKTSAGTIDALIANLKNTGANSDSRKWSGLLLGMVGSSQYDRVNKVLESVLRNEGGIYESWHQAEARNGLQILKESALKSKKKLPNKKQDTSKTPALKQTLSDVKQLTMQNPSAARRHPAFQAIVRRGRTAKTSAGTIDALIANLKNTGANTDSRKWSGLLLGMVGSSQYTRVKKVLESVMRNDGGIYESWHQAEAGNGLRILKPGSSPIGLEPTSSPLSASDSVSSLTKSLVLTMAFLTIFAIAPGSYVQAEMYGVERVETPADRKSRLLERMHLRPEDAQKTTSEFNAMGGGDVLGFYALMGVLSFIFLGTIDLFSTIELFPMDNEVANQESPKSSSDNILISTASTEQPTSSPLELKPDILQRLGQFKRRIKDLPDGGGQEIIDQYWKLLEKVVYMELEISDESNKFIPKVIEVVEKIFDNVDRDVQNELVQLLNDHLRGFGFDIKTEIQGGGEFAVTNGMGIRLFSAGFDVWYKKDSESIKHELLAQAISAFARELTNEKTLKLSPNQLDFFSLDSNDTTQDQGQRSSPLKQSFQIPGGIDFNSELLDLQILRDGNGVPLPVFQQPMESFQIEGFLVSAKNLRAE